MPKSLCVEDISYIYYSGENGSIPNGPKCRKCMNEAYCNGELDDIDKVFIVTKSGLLHFSMRCLTFLCGVISPFSIKYIGEIPVLMNCVQCCMRNFYNFRSKETYAKSTSTDDNPLVQKVSDSTAMNFSHTEEAHRVIKVADLVTAEPSTIPEQIIKTCSKSNETDSNLPPVEDFKAKIASTGCDEKTYAVPSTNDDCQDGASSYGSSYAKFELEPTVFKVSRENGPQRRLLKGASIISDESGVDQISTEAEPRFELPTMAELLEFQRSTKLHKRMDSAHKWFPFMNGRRRSKVDDRVVRFDELSARIFPLMRDNKDVSLEVVVRDYLNIQKLFRCRVCNIEIQINARGFEHFLAKSHFNKVASRNLVFSLSKDLDAFCRLFERAKTKHHQTNPAQERSCDKGIFDEQRETETSSSISASLIDRPIMAGIQKDQSFSELQENNFEWFPFLNGRYPSAVSDPISTFDEISACLSPLIRDNEDVSLEVVVRDYLDIQKRFYCRVCNIKLQINARGFEHFLAKPHFNKVASRNLVFSLSKDLDAFCRLFEKAKTKHHQTDPAQERSCDEGIFDEQREKETSSTISARLIDRPIMAELQKDQSFTELQENYFEWFPFLNGRCPSAVSDPISTIDEISARLFPLLSENKDFSLEAVVQDYFDIQKPLRCHVCNIKVQINAKGFEHFFLIRHFKKVCQQNLVFSLSKDLDVFCRLVEKARKKYRKPDLALRSSNAESPDIMPLTIDRKTLPLDAIPKKVALEESNGTSQFEGVKADENCVQLLDIIDSWDSPYKWFPFLNGRCPSTVSDPIATFGELSGLGPAMRNNKDVSLAAVVRDYLDIQKPVYCRVCNIKLQINGRGFEHFLAKPHFNKVASRNLVFSLSKDLDAFCRLFEKAKTKHHQTNPAQERSCDRGNFDDLHDEETSSTISAPLIDRPIMAELQKYQSFSELQESILKWFPLKGRCASSVSDPISTFDEISARLFPLMKDNKNVSLEVVVRYCFDHWKLSHCGVCGIPVSAKGFDHFFSSRHFNTIFKQNLVFSISKDLDVFCGLVETARKEYKKPVTYLIKAELIQSQLFRNLHENIDSPHQWFPFLNGRMPLAVRDPLSDAAKYSSRVRPLLRSIGDISLDVVMQEFFDNRKPIHCQICDCEIMGYEHFLGKRHFEKILQRKEVFSVSKDLDLFREIVEIARDKCNKHVYDSLSTDYIRKIFPTLCTFYMVENLERLPSSLRRQLN